MSSPGGSSPLRILSVVHGFPPEFARGAELYSLNLALALKARGHRCSVFARSELRDDEAVEFETRRDEVEGLTVWRVARSTRYDRPSRNYSEPRIESAFRAVLVEERPDVVHFQHLIHLSAHLIDVCRELGIATVMHCHDFWPLCPRVQMLRPDGERCDENMGSGCFLCTHDVALSQVPRLAAIERSDPSRLDTLERTGKRRWAGLGDLRRRPDVLLAALSSVDLLLAPSRFLREKLLATGRLDPERVVFSPCGLPGRNAASKQLGGDVLRVGYIGELVEHKGVHVLLEALRMVDGEGIELSVYGDPLRASVPYHARLTELAQGLRNVRFAGRFAPPDLAQVHRELDLLVVPSIWYENAPFVIHEAFQFGTPCLVSNIGGMAELVQDGVNGLHFDVGDARSLAERLRELAAAPDHVRALGSELPTVKSMDENAAEMGALYAKLAGSRERSRVQTLPAISARVRSGTVLQEANDLVLESGTPGAVELEIGPAGTGPRLVRLRVPLRSGDDGTVFGGRVLLGGESSVQLAPFEACGEDEIRTVDVPLALEREGARVRVDNGGSNGFPEHALRIRSVELIDPRREAQPAAGDVLLDRVAREHDASEGAALQQGTDMILLGPEAGRIDFDVSGLPACGVRVTVWMSLRGDEADLPMAGRVLLDGTELGLLGPHVANRRDEIVKCSVYGVLDGSTKLCTIENRLADGSEPSPLRVKRIAITVVGRQMRELTESRAHAREVRRDRLRVLDRILTLPGAKKVFRVLGRLLS